MKYVDCIGEVILQLNTIYATMVDDKSSLQYGNPYP